MNLGYLISLALSSAILFCGGPAYAQDGEFTILCIGQNRNVPTSIPCQFNVMTGDHITMGVTFDDDLFNGSYLDAYMLGSITNLARMQAYASPGSPALLTRFITPELSGNSQLAYSVKKAYGEYQVNYGVDRWRTNLRAGNILVDHGNGLLSFDKEVAATKPYVPVSAWVPTRLWSHRPGTQAGSVKLGEWGGFSFCNNKTNCRETVSVPFNQRPMIPLGHSILHLDVNVDNPVYSEATYNDNRREVDLGNWVNDIENIPTIMVNHDARWDWARRVLKYWFDRGPKIKNPGINTLDWDLPGVIGPPTSWILDRNNASSNRFIDAYRDLISKPFIIKKSVKAVVRAKVQALFAANPAATSVPLSLPWANGPISLHDYHLQHVNRIVGQDTLDLLSTPDAVTAVLGRFSFYFLPIGTATKEGARYKIRITGTRVHVTDSFDFNGVDPLGCWKPPSYYAPISTSLFCVWNSTFRRYRFVKARGYDYNLFTTPVETKLTKDILYYVDK